MDKNTAARPASPAQTIPLLVEISRLDTLYIDLYFQRARELMDPMLPQSTYARIKENLDSIVWLKKQLRAAIERGDWSRSQDLTKQIRSIQESAEANRDLMKFGEALYDGAAYIPIDPFSPGLHVFAGGSAQRLQGRQDRAIEILSTLKSIDDSNKDFYARRESDFKALSINSPTGAPGENEPGEKKTAATPAKLQLEALEALDAGNLSRLDQAISKFMENPVEQETKKESADAGLAEAGLAEAPELGNDLLYSFSEATLAGANRLGLAPVRTESRRHMAYLIQHGWQASFLWEKAKLRSKEQVERVSYPLEQLSYPPGTPDRMKEAIQFFVRNPIITSSGTRYQGCFVTEDLLLEDFPEPEPEEKTPLTGLLSALGLESRWGLTRIDIENALLQHGPRILEKELALDPEAFRLVAIPTDIYAHLATGRGWGQKQMWTHFDGYRVCEDGKLVALAGGDQRFGGAHDVVSFSPAYTNEKIFTRFAVVQRKRMMTWHRK